MDDALAVERTDSGWTLFVAIADPSVEIDADSALDCLARRRVQTLYFPGKPLPMLPEILSVERYSLLPDADRYAMVCEIAITHEGKIDRFSFFTALIRSHAKFSYQQVSMILQGQAFQTPPYLTDATAFVEQLQMLNACTEQLKAYRKETQLVMQNRSDFAFVLNQQGRLESIDKLERLISHQIVEEAMIATNQCAGHFLARHQLGLHAVHLGYKAERRDDIEKLLKEALGDEQVGDTSQLKNYVSIVKTLQKDEQYQLLLNIQQRFQGGSEPSLTAAPHFGLGVEHYANVTSPIRRYQDLYNQRQIHSILSNKKGVVLKDKQVDKIKEVLSGNRSAVKLVEQWLIADYMEGKIGQVFQGYVALLTNQGVGIRLVDNGIEGFIAARKESHKKDIDNKQGDEALLAASAEMINDDKISFNHQRMELTWNETSLVLDQKVDVKLVGVDKARKN